MQKKILAAALAVAGLSLSTVSLAGPGGTPGPTSSLDSIVTLTINGAIKISGVVDIPLGTYAADGVDEVGYSNACVSRNTGGNYTVTVTSLNTFNLVDPGTLTPIPYNVAWAVGVGSAGDQTLYETLAHGAPSSGTYAADVVGLAAPCNTADEKLRVTVPAAGMDTSTAGSYSDTLTVLVAPI